MKALYIKYREIINYIIVGALTTAVSLGVYYACVLTVFDPDNAVLLQAANVISWIAAVTFAYITNRIFVFKSKNKSIWKEAAAFFASRVTTLLLDMALMFLLVTAMDMNDKIAKLLVQVVIMAANYILSKFIVFKKKEK